MPIHFTPDPQRDFTLFLRPYTGHRWRGESAQSRFRRLIKALKRFGFQEVWYEMPGSGEEAGEKSTVEGSADDGKSLRSFAPGLPLPP